MSDFQPFGKAVHTRYTTLAAGELFVVDVEDIYGSYLGAFPEGTNPMFRKATEHDCSCCKNFIRNLGAVVAIENGRITSVWDLDYAALPHPYDVVARRMADLVQQAPIKSVYRTKERQYGEEWNYDTHTPGHRWNHFHGKIGSQHYSAQPEKARGEAKTASETMTRGLSEIRPDDIPVILDLIDAPAPAGLYRGAEKRDMIVAFRDLQSEWLAAEDKNLFVWQHATTQRGQWLARFRNDVIGTLFVDLASGVPLERAVKTYESKVAPQNYKRTTALITPKMIDAAIAELSALGLEHAVERRFAKIGDVRVNNVLFVDRSVQGNMRDGGGLKGALMEEVRPSTASRDKLLSNAEAISADDFFGRILPEAQSIDLMVENKHLGNFVSLTAPVREDTGRLFKWGNDFAWSYDGEVTDSIKQRVKAAGGNVTNAALRVSLAWECDDDYDIHCRGPMGHVYFHAKMGILDVDMNAFSVSKNPVENLSWTPAKLADGVYAIEVNNYRKRSSTPPGFTIELESAGRIEQYNYAPAIPNGRTVQCLEIIVKNKAVVSVKVLDSKLIGGASSTQKWGVPTQTLVPVDTVMLSPNHWDGEGVGNRHHFFMLKGCRNPEPARGIYNEFLRGDLEPHRKVFEVLGSKTKCEPTDEQLSGVGFSAGRGDTVVALVKGKKINKAFEIAF